MSNIKQGDKAPEFTGVNQNGDAVSLSRYAGKKLLLYFYPKDDTPGCTAEACNLRDNYDQFLSKGYAILGVSPDSEKKHQKFIEKYDLPFDLLADTEKETCEMFGVWVKKSMYGREYMGVARTTFIIDENGVIEEVISKVKTKEHTDQILKA
ncbi:MAG: thioredoxin-dependent thiol peroxidase [Bacteroidia bacterium]|nr:thioredoxin-dependent thiol peroxidase [Bacteroidia bacterium]MDG2042391.1 thioredoxin-dependent thiol peroxidase [Bacteroidia bacterium]|tara:strand:- start:4802 stop:5257 length:456 start_codon:yes stop_codon:yes gene_type:complete